MILLRWAWHVLVDWHLPIIFAFGWLPIEAWHAWSQKRRHRWSAERAALRSLRHMHPGPRSIP